MSVLSVSLRTSARLFRESFRKLRSKPTRSTFRKTLLEGLERRDLMAAVPVARDDSAYFTTLNTDLVVTTSSSPAHLLANDLDVDGGTQSASVVTGPSSGTLISFNSNGTFTYRPNTGFTGVDVFTYKVNDGTGDSNVATARVAVGTKLLARQNPESNQMAVDTGTVANNMDLTTGALVLTESVAQGVDLVYRSDSLEKPIIAVETQLAPGVAVPSSITAQLTFNGSAGTTYSYSTSGMTSGQSIRIALQADGTSLATGMYDYTLRIGTVISGVTTYQDFTGKQAIVKRSASEFGKGWYVDGLDQLYDSASGALLVKGNGDTLWFDKPSSSYLPARGDLSNQTLVKNGDNTYTLTSKYGEETNFSTTGILTSRLDSNSNTTSYAYSSGKLATITETYGRTITFAYTSGYLSSITHYSGRVTSFTMSSGKLTNYTLTDPDGAGALAAPVFGFSYNGSNQLTTRTNAVSEATTFAYSSNDGRLRTITHPDTKTRQIIPIDSIGLPTTTTGNSLKKAIDAQAVVTDEMSSQWKFRTDAFGAVTESITALGFATTYLRDSNGRVQAAYLPDPDGAGPLTISANLLGYNAQGDKVHEVALDGGIWNWTYSTSLHRMLSETDAVGRTKSYTYDSNGNRLTEVDGAGYTTTYVYNGNGLPTSITQPDPDGAVALSAPVYGLSYDSYGRLVTLTNPDSSTQTFTYNTADQMLTQVDELAKTTTNTYDSLGRLTSVSNRLSQSTAFAYDAMSRMTKQTDALGNETVYAYNNRGWLSSTTYPDPDGAGSLTSPVDTNVYNGIGNITSKSVAGNNYGSTQPFTYDADGRLTSKADPANLSSTETYTYDNRGRLIAIGDPNLNSRKMTYDAAGRLLSKVQQNYVIAPTLPTIYEAVYYTYTLAGEVATETDGRGNTKSFTYNSRGLLATETMPDPDGSGSQFGQVIAHTYDNIGREISRFDGYDRTTAFEYNSRSWLTKVTDQDPDGAGGASAPVYQFGYNLRGDQTTETDPLGRVTTTAYDFEQRPTSVTLPDPDGAGGLSAPVFSTAYNAVGWVTSTTDARGGVTTTTYDNQGRPLTVTSPDPDGAGGLAAPVTTYQYNSQGLWKTTDAMTRVITIARDAQGRVSSETDGQGNVTSYEYDFYGNLKKMIEPDPDGAGPLGRPETNYTYDPAKRMITKTDARSGVTNYAYDTAGNLISLQDSVNNTTSFAYDGQNRLVMNTNALSKTKSYHFDVSGNLTRTVDRNGKVIQYVYDGLDRITDEKWQTSASPTPTLTVSTTQDGGTFNEVQRVGWTASSMPSGTYTLSYSGQTTSSLAASATAAQVKTALEALSNIGVGDVDVVQLPGTYGTGNVTFQITFQGALAATNVSQMTINVGSLGGYYSTPTAVQATDVTGGTFNEVQQLVLANSTGGTWRLAYNGEVTAPLAYNANSSQVDAALEALTGIDLVSVSGSSGNFTVTFGGTHTNQSVSQIFGDAANASSGSTSRTITTAYNAASEVTSVTDPAATITYTRDNLGRATTVSNVIAGLTPTVALQQAFDAMNNRTELKATAGGTLDFKNTYQFDALQRMTDIVQQNQSGGNAVTAKHVVMAYNALGQKTSIARYQSTGTSNAVASSTFTYDTINRLSGLTHAQGGTTLASYNYGYDGMSRPTSITSSIEGVSTFTYDTTSQLTAADHATQTDETYGYNLNGSRNTTGYTTSTNNRTTSAPGFTFTYDDEGNRTKRTETSTGKVQEYEWDHRNRLTAVKNRNSAMGSVVLQVDYAYDHMNRLLKRTYDADGAGAGAATTQFWVYDEGINAVMQYDGAAASNLSHRYLWADSVDQLLADEQVTSLGSGGNPLWALSDHLGTIRDIADLNEGSGVTSVTTHRTYNAYGALTAETNAAVDLNFGFTGKYLDEATGMQHNLNRWYDSTLGQWVSEDPIGFAAGDENLKRYVYNNILQRVDPFGLQDEEAGKNPSIKLEPGPENNSVELDITKSWSYNWKGIPYRIEYEASTNIPLGGYHHQISGSSDINGWSVRGNISGDFTGRPNTYSADISKAFRFPNGSGTWTPKLGISGEESGAAEIDWTAKFDY